MHLLKQYLHERENVECIISDYGFASYKIEGTDCLIKDIYVQKQFRQLNYAAKLADEITQIAKEAGCVTLTGTVCPAAKGSTTSLKVLLGYGMDLYSSHENFIIFRKDIG